MKPADEPQVHVRANASRPGLVLVAIGSGTDPFSVTPEFAIGLAGQLLDAATDARDALTCGDVEMSGRTAAGRPTRVRADTEAS
ncbi:hypothetical protein ACX9NE_10430 [Mycobacterium sp. ML4]